MRSLQFDSEKDERENEVARFEERSGNENGKDARKKESYSKVRNSVPQKIPKSYYGEGIKRHQSESEPLVLSKKVLPYVESQVSVVCKQIRMLNSQKWKT